MTTTAPKKVTALAVFLSKSGYTEADLSSYNESTRVFATWNGGKYQLQKNSTVRILKGPAYPKYEPPAEE
jgi:hypothetical protein